MKIKWLVLLLLSFVMVSQSVFAQSLTGKVKLITFYGGNWPNSWKGGMLFQLNTTAPGVSYFGINSADNSQQQLLSILLAAKHAQSQVVIYYDNTAIDANGYARVSAITTH